MFYLFENLQLSDFSSLFEIAAALNLAYVVAERAKQYGSVLTKNFFQSGTNIELKFKERYSLIDKESVETMPAINLGNGSTEGEIQKAKRDIHKLGDSKNIRIERLNKQTDNRCVLTSFSFISLYMFFYSLVALFVGGLCVTPFVKAYYLTFTILSLVILVGVSIYGEKEKPQWITNNLSLIKCSWTFVVTILFSLICLTYRNVIEPYSFIFWPIIILISVILPYLAFVIFMMIIHSRLIGLSTELIKEFLEFDEECQKVEAHIHQLKEAYELSVSMDANKEEFSTQSSAPLVI
jgi:hypothetical protein